MKTVEKAMVVNNPYQSGTREALAFENGRNQQRDKDHQYYLREFTTGAGVVFDDTKTYIVFNPKETEGMNAHIVEGAKMPEWLLDGSIKAGYYVFEVANGYLAEEKSTIVLKGKKTEDTEGT